jgi:DNA polymerase III epsilon subunit-like protein
VQIPEGKLIAFDTETTGFSWRKGDRPYCFSFANEKGQTAVFSFPVDPMTRGVTYDDRINIIRAWAEDESITKIAHNAQFDVGMLKGIGIEVKGHIICTMSLIRLLRSDAKLALKPFCKEYLGFPDDDERDLKDATRRARADGKRKGYKVFEGKSDEGSLAPDYWLAGADYFEKYCVLDSIRAMAVYREFIPGIKDTGVEKLWQTELETRNLH